MLSSADREMLICGAAEMHVHLDSLAVERYELYAARLHEANATLNLTRIPPEKTVTLQFLDSLTVARAVDMPPHPGILDIGTGAGFPGLALAIAYPHARVVLMDSTRKKLSFLNTLIEDLNIDNVRLVHGRAEELNSSGLSRAFNLVTARAVARMDRLAAWMLPFIAYGGYAVAYKSADAEPEIEASRKLIEDAGGRLERIVRVELPGEDIVRLLAVITVKSKTCRPDAMRNKVRIVCRS